MQASRKGRPTAVNGVIVRSMLEASWLQFFNMLNVAVEYEPERFPDSVTSIGYLPDFYLKSGVYIEIKPTYKVFRQESQRLTGFVKATGKDLMVIVGAPPGKQIFVIHKKTDGAVVEIILRGDFCWSDSPSPAMKQRERAVAQRAIDLIKDKKDIGTWLIRAISDFDTSNN